MGKKILLKRSSVSGRMPSEISGSTVEKGELFMNIATGTNVNNFLTTLKANGNSANTGDYIKWSDDKYNESKYQPKGSYLTSYTETYKGTITGVTAGNGLTGGGTKSTGSTGLTLNVGSGTGITVSADSVSISTEYKNKIASGTSAYTMVNTLSGALIDVEYVVAGAINKINASAGFDENCNSVLENGMSLTDAINEKVNITDRINSAYTAYSAITSVSATTVPFTGIPTGTTSVTVAVGNHLHSNYLTSETYKGTITGVTAGNGLTGGGGESTGAINLKLDVVAGTGITVTNDGVSISTEYQNKIASGTSAYTMVNTLSGALIDVEYVIASALNQINESAGFDENGNSMLPNGMTLTDAINAKPDTDTLNTVGATEYGSSNTKMRFIGVLDGASASKQSYMMPYLWMDNGALYVGGGRFSIGGNGIQISNDNRYSIGSSDNCFKESYINVMHGMADSATTASKVSVTNITNGTRYLVGTSSASSTSTDLNAYSGVWMDGNLLYATSDERLKDFTDNISVDFEALKSIPKKYFYWKDKENRGTDKEIGTSAQKLMDIYPEIVTTDDKGNLGVSYERLSIIALAAIDKLHERIKILEEKLNDK